MSGSKVRQQERGLYWMFCFLRLSAGDILLDSRYHIRDIPYEICELESHLAVLIRPPHDPVAQELTAVYRNIITRQEIKILQLF